MFTLLKDMFGRTKQAESPVFPTLQSLRDHLNSIPTGRWRAFTPDDNKGNGCVAGHINMALHGTMDYIPRELERFMVTRDALSLDSFRLLSSFGINAREITDRNRYGGKMGVIQLLDKKITELN